jgi:hypothetical protein
MILPNFLIIGASKAATTSLHQYLDAHPEVFMSRIKEMNFFAYSPDGLGFPAEWNKESHHRFPAKTLGEYAAFFEEAGAAKAIGESSPLYLDSPLAPGRIRSILPEVKIVISLRNPVDRIVSDYKMRVRCGFSDESFEEAFQPGSQLYELGFITERLAVYYRIFGADRIKIILFDDLATRLGMVVRDLYSFVGVDPGFTPDLSKQYNAAPENRRSTVRGQIRSTLRVVRDLVLGRDRSKNGQNGPSDRTGTVPVPKIDRGMIAATYRDDILALQKLTGCDLGSWL